MEDQSTFIGKFQRSDTLRTVYEFVLEKVPEIGKKAVVFETVLPKQQLDESRFGETLTALNLTPRGRLIVKYS
jgi:hypothetical protein